MSLTVTTAKSGGILGVVKSSGGSLGGPSASNPQKTYNPQNKTANPQKTVSTQTLQPAAGAWINQTPLYTAAPGSQNQNLQQQLQPAGPTPEEIAAQQAAAAERQRVAEASADWKNSLSATWDSFGDAKDNAALQYEGGIMDFLSGYGKGQNAIDRGSVQNELSREQGRRGVMDMVGTGMRSGGVVLNNANATNSSAAEQLAKAYGQLGRSEMTTVGNQFALGQNNIRAQQEDLNLGVEDFRRNAQLSKKLSVNNIVTETTEKLAQLNSAAMNANIPDRIAIEAEKTRIRNEAMSRLSSLDGLIDKGVKSRGPASADTNRGEAYKLLNAGTAPEKSFNYTSSIPAEFQNTGPFASNLPIFVGKRSDERTRV